MRRRKTMTENLMAKALEHGFDVSFRLNGKKNI
jgi:hypothetical protein